MPGTFTDAWITQSAKILFRGATPPNISKFRVGLANTNTLGRSNSLTDFISNELLQEFGYARSTINFGGDGSYDTTDKRHEMPTATAVFTADGGGLQFQMAFLIADAAAISSLSFADGDVDPSGDRITISGHGFSEGTKLCFTADTLAALPSGITSGTVYEVANSTSNNFQLRSNGGGSIINITDTGSGGFRARTCDGMIVAFGIESNPVTLTDGQTYTYQMPLVVLNSGYTVGI